MEWSIRIRCRVRALYWTEKYLLLAQANPPDALADVVKLLVKLRSELWSQEVVLHRVTVIERGRPFGGSTKLGSNYVVSVPGNRAPSTSLDRTLYLTAYDAIRQRRAILSLRGFGDTVVNQEADERERAGVIGAGHINDFNALLGLLEGSHPDGHQFGTYGVRLPGAVPRSEIKLWGLTTNTRRYVVTAPDFNAEIGDIVRVRDAFGAGLRGANGLTQIFDKDTVAGTYTLMKRQCRHCQPMPDAFGTIEKEDKEVWDWDTIETDGWGTRRTGSGSRRGRGRCRGKCKK